MIVDFAVGAVACLFAGAAAVQWWHTRWWSPQTPGWWLAVTLSAVALTAALFTKVAGRRLGDAVGVVGINEPLARTFLLLAAATSPILLVALTRPALLSRHSRRRTVVPTACLVTLWLAFAAVPDKRVFLPLFDFRPTAAYAVYTAAHLLGLGYALIEVRSGAARFARSSDTVVMRRSLLLVSWGCTAGLGYVLLRCATTAAFYVGPAEIAVTVQSLLGRSLAVLGGALLAAGCLLPRATRLRADLRTDRQHRRLLVALEPAWQLARAAYPHVVLSSARPRWPLGGRGDARQRLYRRLIELRDAQFEHSRELGPPNEATTRFGRLVAAAPAPDTRTLTEIGAEARWWLEAQAAVNTSAQHRSTLGAP